MTYKMIYIIGLALMSNDILCFSIQKPQITPTPCNWPYLRCLGYFKPTVELNKPFFPVLQINFKNKDENIQIDRIFPSILINKEKNNYASKNEQKISFLDLNAEEPSSEANSDHKEFGGTFTNPKRKQIIFDDLNSLNIETSTDNVLNSETVTDYTDDNNIITTTEEQEVTTEDVFYRLSDLPPEVLATFLG